MKIKSIGLLCASSLSSLLPLCANAQTAVTEDFNSNSTTTPWTALNGACLTASTLYTSGTVPAGTIPGCVTSTGTPNPYYAKVVANNSAASTLVGSQTGTTSLPDTASSGTVGTPSAVRGTGALRLTNGSLTTGTNGNNETGAIISNTAFPSNGGLQITFNTVTYGGNAYNNGAILNGNSGADGISFFLADAGISAVTTGSGSTATTTYPTMAVGSIGGSLGYDCSTGNSPPDGMVGAYIGVGIDEFGNFANKNDNGNKSDPNAFGTKQPNTISIRGAGNINTAMVNALNASTPYPAVISTTGPITTTSSTSTKTTTTTITSTTTTTNYSVQATTVVSLCASPTYTIVATPTTVTTTATSKNGGAYKTATPQTSVGTTTTTTTQTVMDYPFIKSGQLISGDNIFNQEANKTNPARKNAYKISYSLTLTTDGLLSLSYSYNGGALTPIIKHQSITGTGTGVANGKLPDNFLFGFAAGTGGGSNVHEITCFKAQAITNSAGSAAGNVPQNAKVKSGDGTQIYLASYSPTYWTGSLTASGLTVDPTYGTVTINATANWDAGCALSGTANMPASIGTPGTAAGTCATTGGNVLSAQGAGNRGIATWDDVGRVAVPFNYSKMTGAQQKVMDNGPYLPNPIDGLGSIRVAYLRGDQSNEANYTFRSRTSVLGDIINSSPVWVGLPSASYTQSWQDLLYPTATFNEPSTGANTYAAFQSGMSGKRLNVVYVGANDGMLHGFRAGYDSLVTATNGTVSTVTKTTYNDGEEVLAYVPSLAFSTIHSVVDAAATTNPLDYSDPTYAHNAFVDATPGVGDLFYNGSWHTWLVGGLGAGGNGGGVINSITAAAVGDIYALDITSQSVTNALPTDATVVAQVIGDWNTNSGSNSTGLGAATGTTFANHLGSTYGTPIIRRLHDGNWAAIFGNGLNSVGGTAGIFIMEVISSTTGAPTISFTYIDTGVGASSDPTNASTKNGIAYVASADLDGDHIVDYIYAGDALGNVWRFDLTGNTSALWAAASPFKLFSASTSTFLQPITTAVTVSSILVNGSNRIMIDFGTGQEFPQTLDAAATFAATDTSTSATNKGQFLYGIWDWNMSAWNAINEGTGTTGTTPQYAALPTTSAPTISASTLTQQQLTSAPIPAGGSNTSNATQGYTATEYSICWPTSSGSANTGCTSSPSISYGWEMPLPNTTEQIVYNPTVNSGVFFVNSIIPAGNLDATQCTISNAAGFSYAIDVATGGGTNGVFNTVTGQPLTTSSGTQNNIVGIGLNGVGTPYFVTSVATSTTGATTNVTTMISQTQNGTPIADQITLPPPPCTNNCGSGVGGYRLTWLEIR